jgi:hypothetical protein
MIGSIAAAGEPTSCSIMLTVWSVGSRGSRTDSTVTPGRDRVMSAVKDRAGPDTIPLHPQTTGRNPDSTLIARSKIEEPQNGDFCSGRNEC